MSVSSDKQHVLVGPHASSHVDECSPGSHKANYRLPQSIQQSSMVRAPVVCPAIKKGSLLIFMVRVLELVAY